MAAPQSTTPSVLRPSRLAHVVLSTTRFKPMVAFYKAFLGAQAAYETEDISFLSFDEEHHRIAIISFPGPAGSSAGPRRPGLEHTAYTYDTLADLVTAYRQRKALGIRPLWCVNHGPTTSMYYADPDGNQLEAQVDNFATAEEATAFMHSPAFAENPIGVDYDPEELARRVDAGEDDAEIKRRPNIGARSVSSTPLFEGIL